MMCSLPASNKVGWLCTLAALVVMAAFSVAGFGAERVVLVEQFTNTG